MNTWNPQYPKISRLYDYFLCKMSLRRDYEMHNVLSSAMATPWLPFLYPFKTLM